MGYFCSGKPAARRRELGIEISLGGVCTFEL
jgi:hypothetical protein